MATFEEVLEDRDGEATFQDLGAAAAVTSPRDAFDAVNLADATLLAWLESLALSASVSFSDALATPGRGLLVRGSFAASDDAAANGTYGLTASALSRWVDSFRNIHAMVAQGQMTLSDAADAALVMLLMDRMNLSDLVAPSALRGVSVTASVRLLDEVLRFFGLVAQSALTVSGAAALLARRPAGVVATVTASDAAGHVLVVRLEATGEVELTLAQALQAVYAQTLTEDISISALIISPQGVTTWAVNTRSGAATEYTGYDFNSFARVGPRYMGASSQGLFRLTGDDDDGDPIIATIRGGALQINGTRMHGLAAAYLGVNGEGAFFLRIIGGNGEATTYRAVATPDRTAKVWMGKGLRHRYMTFELVSTGQDFDLDTIEFVPLRGFRRI